MTIIGTVVEFINLTLPAYTLYCILWAIVIILHKWRLKHEFDKKWYTATHRTNRL
jgi:hypothetical protein